MAFRMTNRSASIVFLLACMTLAASASISCFSAETMILPCLNYLRYGGTLTRRCCNGVSSLNAAAATTPDRQATCTCLKQAATTVPGLQPRLIATLPRQCGVMLPYQISPTMDCSKVV